MSDKEPSDGIDESIFNFGFLDIALTLALSVFLYWFFYYRNKKQDEYSPSTKSYSIQPTLYTATSPIENSFIKKLQTSGRSLVVFYGSQTGTGEEFAGRLAKEGVRYSMKGMVADPEECDMVRHQYIIKNTLSLIEIINNTLFLNVSAFSSLICHICFCYSRRNWLI